MICKYQEKTYDAEDTRYCLILSDTKPATFPTTGVGVEGLPDSVKLDSGSILLVLGPPSEKYVLGEDGQTWHKWEA